MGLEALRVRALSTRGNGHSTGQAPPSLAQGPSLCSVSFSLFHRQENRFWEAKHLPSVIFYQVKHQPTPAKLRLHCSVESALILPGVPCTRYRTHMVLKRLVQVFRVPIPGFPLFRSPRGQQTLTPALHQQPRQLSW